MFLIPALTIYLFLAVLFPVDFFLAEDLLPPDLPADEDRAFLSADLRGVDFFAPFFLGAAFLFAAPFFAAPFFLGTLAPSLRASDKPIAIACFREVTFFPLRPLLSFPLFISCIVSSTFSPALFEYFAIKNSYRLVNQIAATPASPVLV